MAQPPVRIEDQVAKVADRLVTEYADSVPDRVVRDLVHDAYAPLSHAKVTQFVPVLVDRSVRERLKRGA